jgi:uncharacterized protein
MANYLSVDNKSILRESALIKCAKSHGQPDSGLGFCRFCPDNGLMNTENNQEKGFQFPGLFEITAMGSAVAGLATLVPRELQQAGLVVLHETVSSRASSTGRYVSVTIQFRAESRAQYEAAHEALRAHPEIKWTL